MNGLIWLASYPKSGNTWLRFLLTNLLHGPVASSTEIARFIPDVHRDDDAAHFAGRPALLAKTHYLPARLPDALPAPQGAVYILRHPLDVLASHLNYLLLHGRETLLAMPEAAQRTFLARSVEDYVDRGGFVGWIELGMGSWLESVAAWTDPALPFPVLTVRYEDLHRQPLPTLRRIARFLGAEVDDGRLSDAVAQSSFAAMKALEEREIAAAAPGLFHRPELSAAHRRGLRFLHRGRSGTAALALTADQRRRAESRFAETMARFGYS